MFVDFVSKLPTAILGTIGVFWLVNSFVNKSFKKNLSYNVIVILIYSLLNCGLFIDKTNLIQLLLSLLLMVLVIKCIYDISAVSSIILSIFTIVFLILSKILLSTLFVNSMEIINGNLITSFLFDVSVIVIAYIIAKINIVQRIIRPIIKRFENYTIKGELRIIVLVTGVLTYFNYQMLSNRYLVFCNVCFLLFIFTLIVFSIIYIRNKNRYKELKDSYDNLFDHACLYEEELEKDTLLRHEYKNQLAVIKGLTKNKKVSNHINQILESNKKEELINIKGLNNLPKGGLRGLFYYKITTIRKNNIDFSIDISKNVKGYLSKITLEDMKTLTYILGIFCDNAIEECIKDKKSNISIEMYYIDKEVHIIVSNSIIDKIDLDKIGTRGYSTKGKNRGNGLYLIKKMLQEEEKMYISTKIINNYLIQSLKIRL